MKRAICRSRSAKCISAFYDITATDSTLSHFFARSPKLADSNSGNIFFGPPAGYVTPRWPGLYVPLPGREAKYLYTPGAIWRYTTLWTLVLFSLIFLLSSLFCIVNFSRRHLRLSLLAPLVFGLTGALAAFISATVVGYCLAALYNAAFLRMSTWVPALWAAVQTLLLVYFASTTSTGFVG